MNWVTQYGNYSAKVAGFDLVLVWGGEGYTVRFEKWALKTVYKDLDDAKNAALKFARKKAEQMLAELS